LIGIWIDIKLSHILYTIFSRLDEISDSLRAQWPSSLESSSSLNEPKSLSFSSSIYLPKFYSLWFEYSFWKRQKGNTNRMFNVQTTGRRIHLIFYSRFGIILLDRLLPETMLGAFHERHERGSTLPPLPPEFFCFNRIHQTKSLRWRHTIIHATR